MRDDFKRETGQAANEYVALLAVVAAVMAGLVGLTSGGVGAHVLAGLQRGICAVTGAACRGGTVAERDRLTACPLERRLSEERLSETIASVRLSSSGTLTAVRSSDGRVTVTLADGSGAGLETGAGAWVALGRTVGGEAKAGIGLVWASGRSWTFPDEQSAQRFVARYGDKATIRGKLVDEVRGLCSLLCDAVGWRPHPQLPEPDETHAEGGAAATLAEAFGGHGGGDAGLVLGRRLRRDGEKTWYLRLNAKAAAELRLPGAELVASGTAQAMLSYRLDRDDRPLSLGVHLVGEGSGRVALAGVLRRGTANGSGKAGETRGGVVELDATLDLGDDGDRAAAGALLKALGGVVPAVPQAAAGLGGAAAEVGRSAAELGARIAARAQVDVRRYALSADASRYGGALALGLKLGGAFERSAKGLRLVDARTRLPGLPFLARDDCRGV
jgi:hypothetical protein